MSKDIFYECTEVVNNNVREIDTMHERWAELLGTTNTARNDEFSWINGELKKKIEEAFRDLTDLEATVKRVEQNRAKFPALSDDEVKSRRAFIEKNRQAITKVRDSVESSITKAKLEKDNRDALLPAKAPAKIDKHAAYKNALEKDNDKFIENELMQRQLIREDQDVKLDQLGNVVGNIRGIAAGMEDELGRQKKTTDRLENEIDRADSQLKTAQKKLTALIKQTDDKMSICAIFVLVTILIVLLALIIKAKANKNKD